MVKIIHLFAPKERTWTMDYYYDSMKPVNERTARCTSIPRSQRVRRRATLQGVNCRQPNLTLSVADSTARTRDLLVTRRQLYRCSKAPLHETQQRTNQKNKKKKGIANTFISSWRSNLDVHMLNDHLVPTVN